MQRKSLTIIEGNVGKMKKNKINNDCKKDRREKGERTNYNLLEIIRNSIVLHVENYAQLFSVTFHTKPLI